VVEIYAEDPKTLNRPISHHWWRDLGQVAVWTMLMLMFVVAFGVAEQWSGVVPALADFGDQRLLYVTIILVVISSMVIGYGFIGVPEFLTRCLGHMLVRERTFLAIVTPNAQFSEVFQACGVYQQLQQVAGVRDGEFVLIEHAGKMVRRRQYRVTDVPDIPPLRAMGDRYQYVIYLDSEARNILGLQQRRGDVVLVRRDGWSILQKSLGDLSVPVILAVMAVLQNADKLGEWTATLIGIVVILTLLVGLSNRRSEV
jgi:hypothetical protein